MWISQIALGLVGLGGGFVVAGGTIALIVGLGIIPRFAGITHTAHRILLYEECVLFGAILGNICYVYQFPVLFGAAALICFGLFSGIYVGSWIVALAEVVNAFPIFARRIGLTKGVSFVIACMALGKIGGSLMHFWHRW